MLLSPLVSFVAQTLTKLLVNFLVLTSPTNPIRDHPWLLPNPSLDNRTPSRPSPSRTPSVIDLLVPIVAVSITWPDLSEQPYPGDRSPPAPHPAIALCQLLTPAFGLDMKICPDLVLTFECNNLTLTPELEEKFIAALKKGVAESVACQMCGWHYSTYLKWHQIARGEEVQDRVQNPKVIEFIGRVHIAIALCPPLARLLG